MGQYFGNLTVAFTLLIKVVVVYLQIIIIQIGISRLKKSISIILRGYWVVLSLLNASLYKLLEEHNNRDRISNRGLRSELKTQRYRIQSVTLSSKSFIVNGRHIKNRRIVWGREQRVEMKKEKLFYFSKRQAKSLGESF